MLGPNSGKPMRCDTCKQESPLVMRVVIAERYNRILSRPIFNCQACFDKKETTKPYTGAQAPKADKEQKA